MDKPNDFKALEADFVSHQEKIKRIRTNIMISAELKEKIVSAYGEGNLGRVLEVGALMKLRRDGFIPAEPKGAEPANMDSYLAAKKEKVALEEIKERVEKVAPKKPK